MRIAVVLNRNAGMREGVDVEAVRAEVDALGMDGIVASVPGREIDAALERAANRADAVVVGGGDGTVSAAARHCMHQRPLGVLPLGTYNHFARDLGLPLDWRAALRVVAGGATRAIDVGRVNERIFINNSSIGMYAEVVHERERLESELQRRSWLPRFTSVLSAMHRFRRLAVTLRTDAGPIRCETPFVFVGNNQYRLAAPRLGMRDRLDGGQLCVHVCHHPRRVAMLALALRALVDRVHEDADFDSFHSPEITIDSRSSRLKVALDGEVKRMRPPLFYRSDPGALDVFVDGGTE